MLKVAVVGEGFRRKACRSWPELDPDQVGSMVDRRPARVNRQLWERSETSFLGQLESSVDLVAVEGDEDEAWLRGAARFEGRLVALPALLERLRAEPESLLKQAAEERLDFPFRLNVLCLLGSQSATELVSGWAECSRHRFVMARAITDGEEAASEELQADFSQFDVIVAEGEGSGRWGGGVRRAWETFPGFRVELSGEDLGREGSDARILNPLECLASKEWIAGFDRWMNRQQIGQAHWLFGGLGFLLPAWPTLNQGDDSGTLLGRGEVIASVREVIGSLVEAEARLQQLRGQIMERDERILEMKERLEGCP